MVFFSGTRSQIVRPLCLDVFHLNDKEVVTDRQNPHAQADPDANTQREHSCLSFSRMRRTISGPYATVDLRLGASSPAIMDTGPAVQSAETLAG